MANVLLIEDEPQVRGVVREMLVDLGHTVIEAAHGRAAMQRIAAQPLDLVICDLFMPEQDGLGTIRELLRVDPQLPILAISGRESLYLRVARGLGAAASLAKPFGPSELQRSVDKLLREYAGRRQRAV